LLFKNILVPTLAPNVLNEQYLGSNILYQAGLTFLLYLFLYLLKSQLPSLLQKELNLDFTRLSLVF